MERVAADLPPVAGLGRAGGGRQVDRLAHRQPAPVEVDGHERLRGAAGVEHLGGVEQRHEVLPARVAAEDLGQLVEQRVDRLEAVGERVHLALRLVAGLGQPVTHDDARVGDVGELGLSVGEPRRHPAQVGDHVLQHVDVDVAVVDEGRLLAAHLRQDPYAGLRHGDELVEGVAEASYVAHRAAGDRHPAPHVATDALDRALQVVGLRAGALDRRDRGVGVTGVQRVLGGGQLGARVLGVARGREERDGQQDQDDQQQEQAADDGGRPDQPSRRGATGGRHAPMVPKG